MSEKVLCEKSDLVATAAAVRQATGSAENYNVSELSAATIGAISSANPILQDKTVTPTALDQIITPDSNYNGLSQVTVKGDADLKAENITEGVTIFNVAGSNPYEKTATNAEVSAQADLIAQISTALEGKTAGGGANPVLQAKTVIPSVSAQTVKPDSGYDGLSQVTVNAMPTGSVANPSISISSSGLITATTAVNEGYVDGTDKTGTKQLTTQAAQTITPGTSNKTIASGRYLTGTQTIKGDANLKAANIAKGVSIFGVTGTHEGGEDVSAETAEYTELLTDLESAINTLPEAGGGGGSGTIDTCTVSINYSVSRSALYMWDVVGYDAESGEIIQHYNSTYYPAEGVLTFDNVVCGSVFSLYCEGMGLPSSCDVTGGAEVLILGMIQGASCTRIHVKAPTTAGSVCTCTVT